MKVVVVIFIKIFQNINIIRKTLSLIITFLFSLFDKYDIKLLYKTNISLNVNLLRNINNVLLLIKDNKIDILK